MCTAKQAEYARVVVRMVLCLGGVDPVVLSQHVEVELCEHPFPRSSGREGASTAHQGVEDGKGKEILFQEGGALEGQDNVGEVGERVWSDHGGTAAGDLRRRRVRRQG